MEQVEEAILKVIRGKFSNGKGFLVNDLLVMKFGGTSVGSAERMRVAARISAEQRQQRPTLVVVSAMSKVTDLLIDSMRHAEGGDRAGLEANLRSLEERHTQACRELLPPAQQPAALAAVEELLAAFRRITGGMLMLNDRPPRSVDEALAIGERLSALLVAAFLESEGVRAVAVNAAGAIVTDAVYGNASPVMEATREKARQSLGPLLESGVLPVVTGFNGATADGRPTTLGRGGSDFSAAILAAALDAAELWIWTDVDGIMTADPRLVPEARVLSEVTYSEAAELAYNGAKVLHPRTLAPLADREIPVWSKNSFAVAKAWHEDRVEDSGVLRRAGGDLHGESGPDLDGAVQCVADGRAGHGARARRAGQGQCGSAGAIELQFPPEFLRAGAERRVARGHSRTGNSAGFGVGAWLSGPDRGG